jgi:hypothetical protein
MGESGGETKEEKTSEAFPPLKRELLFKPIKN